MYLWGLCTVVHCIQQYQTVISCYGYVIYAKLSPKYMMALRFKVGIAHGEDCICQIGRDRLIKFVSQTLTKK